MTIKILPARLANQIAAGEVVERPASVVKELVENSLDSGATRIDIDIEKGGAKLIRVRDNGQGIPKEELTLALSRHATSKIHTLDDLEAIMSLGFRGEALASISSVSRLMMTSRPEMQEEAWMAYSEGRDMTVQLQPAAHPVGTTVEVIDLFFNTPARRKFLRTEKTEFTHIDEVLKRIALSRFDVTICLRHNGKVVRQYRAAVTEIQQEKRLAAVCGQNFVHHLLKIELEHQGLSLHGWITTPEGARQQSDLQYCYVNGRMMKDKLINHAIRQSYEAGLSPEQYAAYVLYISLEPHQVDVNVHPAKHEVRFHQARLVHDFIYQALTSALSEGQYIQTPELNQGAFHQCGRDDDTTTSEPLSSQILDAIQRTPSSSGRGEVERDIKTSEIVNPDIPGSEKSESYSLSSIREPATSWDNSPRQPKGSQHSTAKGNHRQALSSQEVDIYQRLMQVHEGEKQDEVTPSIDSGTTTAEITALGKALAVVQGQYLLMHTASSCCLVALNQASLLKMRKQFDAISIPLKGQPLLVPLSVKVSAASFQTAELFQSILQQLGIELKLKGPETLMVMSVPQPLRRQNLQRFIPDLVSYASCLQPSDQQDHLEQIINWLAERVSLVRNDYTLSEAIQLIAEMEQLFQGNLPLSDPHFVQLVDFSATMTALHS